ncbi:hypothetical protein Emed_002976 [Eimeria media]
MELSAKTLGAAEFFKKLFRKGSDNEEEEVPLTSEQRRGAWREEERHAEFAFCTDVGFRGRVGVDVAGSVKALCFSLKTILCKAIKKPTNFDITSAVKQEMTFDLEAQQQEQLQQLQQQQLLVQQQLAQAGAAEAAGLAGGAFAAPETFAAAAYERGRSTFPRWALYLIFAAVAVLCLSMLCCAACCRR